jgi:MFS-type transporter involved in bile tolerance (Atg22 family)
MNANQCGQRIDRHSTAISVPTGTFWVPTLSHLFIMIYGNVMKSRRIMYAKNTDNHILWILFCVFQGGVGGLVRSIFRPFMRVEESPLAGPLLPIHFPMQCV